MPDGFLNEATLASLTMIVERTGIISNIAIIVS